MEESYGRDPRFSGGLDYNPSPIRDISRYVEPLDDFCDSARMGPPQSRPERITYPTMGGGGVGGAGSGGAPPFGQSYPAFAAQSFGGMMDYGSRGRSPAGRSYR
ncbi:hypothetical protein TELCIR_19608 [Teladorsagia circumcincta]|uniref:Uncharacterized protein n=1 Tax=Teladorsagia circumcincta TaxID=45464 RepID=A0A2G9TN89_TELCI|nr:hypothetical protein TELCIR_19608 [Teladorsagia circumcincta]